MLQITRKVGIDFYASRPDFSPDSCGISCIAWEVSIFGFLNTFLILHHRTHRIHKPYTKLRNKTYLSILAVSIKQLTKRSFRIPYWFSTFSQPAEQIELKFATRSKSGWTKYSTEEAGQTRASLPEKCEKTKPGSYYCIYVLKSSLVLITLRLNPYYIKEIARLRTLKANLSEIAPVKIGCINTLESSVAHDQWRDRFCWD